MSINLDNPLNFKKKVKNLALGFLFFAFIFPASVSAQSFYEGKSEGEVRGWWGRNDDFENSINELDEDRVEDVPMPILFGLTPDNLTKNFGDPRSGGRIHEGLDIMAPKRALVVSPTDAVVIRTGFGDSAGHYVYTANPGGETFVYMHLDEIADIDEGDELDKGDLIGYVGNTGNASGGSTHLHFEISDGDPTDPYPRLTVIFPLADKIKYLEKILDEAEDTDELAEVIVKMYSKDLNLAVINNIVLPEEISKYVTTAPKVAVQSSGTNLMLGSKGTAVVELQKFLIKNSIGSASRVIADGSFGPITQKALADYQLSVGISPAAGYYGPITRAYISVNA